MVVKLNRDSKLRYFHNIETSKNSKPFWNVCKPYFSNKHAHEDSKIILIENEKITNNSNKAYDSLPHDLLVAKFEAYGIDKNGVNLIHNYLPNRKQRTKISSSYSEWYDIVRGVPQGSILGPLFFNLFINDLFLFIERTNICNFADDNTIYSCNINLQTILKYDM